MKIVWLLALQCLAVHGQTGKNDTIVTERDGCLAATTIADSFVQGSNVGAPIYNVPVCSGYFSFAPGSWYTVTGTGGRMNLDTCGENTLFDTIISVYEGDCIDLVCVDANDQFCGSQSSVGWNSELGTTYYVLVHGFDTSDVGNFTLRVADTPPEKAQNDLCENAEDLSALFTEDLGYNAVGTTIGATKDSSECVVPHTSPDVWYTIQGTGETFTADTCFETTDFDTQISIYEGDDCSSLMCIDANDDNCPSPVRASSVSWRTKLFTNYYVVVHGFQNATGTFDLLVSDLTSSPTFSPTDPPNQLPTPQPIPENSQCNGSMRIRELDSGSTFSAIGSTSGAGVEESVACEGNLPQAPGIWFDAFGTGRRMMASTCNSKTSFSTKIAVFQGPCDDLKCVQTEPTGCFEDMDSVSWESTEDVLYRIYIYGSSSGQEGEFILEVASPRTPVQPPPTTPPTPSTPALNDGESSSVPVAAIIGGAVGGVAVLSLALVAIVYLKSRSNNRAGGTGEKVVEHTADPSRGSDSGREIGSTGGYTSATPRSAGSVSTPGPASSGSAAMGAATRVSHDPPTGSEELNRPKKKKNSRPAATPVQFKDQCQSVLGVPLASAQVVPDDE